MGRLPRGVVSDSADAQSSESQMQPCYLDHSSHMSSISLIRPAMAHSIAMPHPTAMPHAPSLCLADPGRHQSRFHFLSSSISPHSPSYFASRIEGSGNSLYTLLIIGGYGCVDRTNATKSLPYCHVAALPCCLLPHRRSVLTCLTKIANGSSIPNSNSRSLFLWSPDTRLQTETANRANLQYDSTNNSFHTRRSSGSSPKSGKADTQTCGILSSR
jgi:hypothetical protein